MAITDVDRSLVGRDEDAGGVGVGEGGAAGARVVDCEGEIDFPDPALALALQRLMQETAGAIRPAHVSELTRANLGWSRITDLSGLECLTNLTYLNLGDNEVDDLRPLAGLSALSELHLSDCGVSDLSPLADLTALTVLSLAYNPVSDLSPLAGLSELRRLVLSNTRVEDLGPLAGLTAMRELYLDYNEISDLSPLAGMTSLTVLWLQHHSDAQERGPLSDLTPLEGLASLNGLHLHGNSITDLGPLAANPGIGAGDVIELRDNLVSCAAQAENLAVLRERMGGHNVYTCAMRGVLEEYTGGAVYGWVKLGGGSEPATVRLLLDGEIFASVVADAYRFDLHEEGLHPTGLAGFSVQVGELGPASEISVYELASGEALENSPMIVQ